ncbi:MAG TPA: DUF308 domain-containing protein [Chloroflexota bacterium]
MESKGETGNEAFILEAISVMSQTLVTKARRVFSHARFSVAFEGVLALAVGIAVLVWPSASLAAMVVVFAAYAVADGLLSILVALTERDGLSFLRGAVSLTVATAALAWRDMSGIILVYVIAVWVILMAVFRIRGAVHSKRAQLLKAVLVLLALPSVAGGLVAVLSPSQGATSVLMDIAIFQIINGLVIVGFALRAAPAPKAFATQAG